MTNPIPSEAEIEAAENAAKQALAAVEQLRKQREAAEQAAGNRAALMAAFEGALETGRFELVNGELVDAHASRGLSPDEKFILTLARKGRVTVDELAGKKVVFDEALGNVQKSNSAPQLTNDEKFVVALMRGPDPRVKVCELGGKKVVFDGRYSFQLAKQRRQRQDGADRAAQAAQPQPAPTQEAGVNNPPQTPPPAPSTPQPPQAVEPPSEPSGPPRRHLPRRPVPSGQPSQATGGPVPTGAGDGGSYGPPLGWGDRSLDDELFAHTPQDPKKPKKGLWERIVGS